MSDSMSEFKNINTESDFENRVGLVVWLKSKRNVKRLMNFGILHYVSHKMNYALIYVDKNNVDRTIDKLMNESYIKSVEKSNLRDLPITFDEVLINMQAEIDEQKQKEEIETFSKGFRSNEMDF